MTGPRLIIDDAAFRANISAVVARVEPAQLMFVVKDDAYGHGVEWAVSSAAAVGVRWIGTFDVATAQRVRAVVGDTVRIFAWVTSSDAQIDCAAASDIDLGVGAAEYLDRVIARAAAVRQRIRVHLKIDSGLHRSGLLADEWDQAVRVARHAEQQGLIELVGVWSHLAEASDEEDDAARARFLRAVRAASAEGGRVEYTHLTASAATWARPELRGNLVRVGAFCYGIRSADGPELEGIVPAATLAAPVVAVEGSTVTVDVGSFDGLPSILGGRVDVGTPAGPRLLREVHNFFSRVESWPGASIGDEVRIFGSGTMHEQSATTLAESIGTVGEEILTRLGPRIRREVVSDEPRGIR